MPRFPEERRVIQSERSIIQAMCQGTIESSIRESGRLILEKYRWREPVHQVVFEILLEIPAAAPGVIREQLPARLTRRGFPDVNWEIFFEPHLLRREDAERLMRELRDAG